MGEAIGAPQPSREKGTRVLSRARKDVEDLFGHIEEAIERLSQATRRRLSRVRRVPPVSVFERASSLSETDSATPSSHRSLSNKSEHWASVGEENAEQFQSPTACSPADFKNPITGMCRTPQGTIPARHSKAMTTIALSAYANSYGPITAD